MIKNVMPLFLLPLHARPHVRIVMLKKVLFILYVVVLIVMAIATFVEPTKGTDYVSAHFYGSWWFIMLWVALAAAAIIYFIKRRVRRVSLVALHVSFVIILLGAMLTHLLSRQGTIHLRIGETSHTYIVSDKAAGDVQHSLPFEMTLNSFDIVYHEGTTSVADYVSTFTINDGNETLQGEVSMNKIFSHRSIRIYQMSYDTDGRGARLSINTDPWGIGVTYTGYALLFFSLAWMLIDPKGGFRKALRALNDRTKAVAVIAMVMVATGAQAQSTTQAQTPHTISKATAELFGQLYVMHNGRICPMQTLAIDFTKKLYGKTSYKGYTAEQVLAGFLFWPQEWEKEPIIKLKGGALRDRLQLPKYTSVMTFFDRNKGGYIIGPYVAEYYRGSNDKLHTQAADIDDRLQLVMDLRRGAVMKIFPYQDSIASLSWYSPIDDLPQTMEPDRQSYIHSVLKLLYQEIHSGNNDTADELLCKMLKYQIRYGGASLPSPTAVKAERLYNRIPFATILFMVNLSLGLLSLPVVIKRRHKGILILHAIAVFSFLALTLCLALRWIISGTVPMANGYETMLLMAWLVLLAAVIMCRRVKIMLSFGFLLSGFFLLVSHISQMDPQITHIMPVLSSPLLSVHVSLVMMSFALLSLTFLCSATALIMRVAKRSGGDNYRLLSLLFLYPAMALLGAGIFVGAIWANVSWGTYWSWDPKEVWALITFMVYAVGLHRGSVKVLQRLTAFHIYMVIAFLTILMTYFGVNYILGGMHSYA